MERQNKTVYRLEFKTMGSAGKIANKELGMQPGRIYWGVGLLSFWVVLMGAESRWVSRRSGSVA